MTSPMLAAALDLAARTFRVLPLHTVDKDRCSCHRGKSCDRKGKHPRLDAWQSLATTDPAQIRAWWSRNPGSNVGIACGGPARVVVVDVDGPEGRATLATLEAEHGALPATLTSRSGRPDGGEHRFFHVPPDLELAALKNRASHVGPKVDIRAEGGQVVAPPSMHASGARYAWVDLDTPIASLPRWLYELATREAPTAVRAVESAPTPPVATRESRLRRPPPIERARLYLATYPPAVSGQGGHARALLAAEHAVRGFRLSDDDAFAALQPWNRKCLSPWSEKELRHKIQEAREKGTAVRWGQHVDEDRPLPPRVSAGVDGPSEDIERAAIQGESEAVMADTDFDPAALEGAPRGGATTATEPPSRPAFNWITTAGIFAPLPETRWISRDLQICPGRPAMLAGYGASGKTLGLQSLALSVATGERIWGQFSAREPRIVRHVDHEQGRVATALRYQRLARGLGISPAQLEDAEAAGRLAIACFPAVYLNRPEAEDVYCREFERVDLVVIDALKGATPGTDENDSKIRDCIDTLTRVSEQTGCAFTLIHHAGKPKEGHSDARTVLRGSSAIFDACGSVFVMVGAKGEPKLVTHQKAAAESTGGMVEDFYLAIEDVLPDGSPASDSVRITYRTREQIRPPRAPDADARELRALILEAVRLTPGIAGKQALATILKRRRPDVGGMVDQLLAEGLLVNRGTSRAPRYYVAAAPDADE